MTSGREQLVSEFRQAVREFMESREKSERGSLGEKALHVYAPALAAIYAEPLIRYVIEHGPAQVQEYVMKHKDKLEPGTVAHGSTLHLLANAILNNEQFAEVAFDLLMNDEVYHIASKVDLLAQWLVQQDRMENGGRALLNAGDPDVLLHAQLGAAASLEMFGAIADPTKWLERSINQLGMYFPGQHDAILMEYQARRQLASQEVEPQHRPRLNMK